MALAVEAQQLVKHFGGKDGEVEAVRGVDLAVEAGSVFGFLGSERSRQVDHGQDADDVDDDHVRHRPCRRVSTSPLDAYEARNKIGVALQEAGLDPRQTGRELLVLQGRLFKLSRSRSRRSRPGPARAGRARSMPPTAGSRATRAA